MDLIIELDETSGLSLHRQIYRELRRAILAGRVVPGQRIPSTRALAQHLGISRATVTLGYEQLTSEGYLETLQGSGTCVCRELPDDLLKPDPTPANRPVPARTVLLSPSGRALARMAFSQLAIEELPCDFRHGRPALEAFPMAVWNRLLARHGRAQLREMLDYEPDPRGHRSLREAIVAHLRQTRAVQCDADQVIIVSGAQQALDLAARVLVQPGETVAMEDPGYPGASSAFRAHGAKLLALPVVDGALSLAPLKNASRCRLVYVTPSHQYPTGIVLSLSQRLELLDRCRQAGARIVEDDYDSEFRYGGRPLPSMQGLDDQGSVIYVGTFSKTMFPALRIGYLVAPRDLEDVLARARWATDRQTPSLEQYALNDFIREGHLDNHIRKMRKLYGRRREVLMEELQRWFSGRVTVWGASAGLHLMVRFSTRLQDAELVRRAAAVGVGLENIAFCRIEGKGRGEFLLRFGCLDEVTIREGMRRLATVMNPF